jgi:hypothetical protein
VTISTPSLSELPQMLERDRNRDGMLDPDELEKDGPAKLDTPDRNHSGTLSRRNWDDCD